MREPLNKARRSPLLGVRVLMVTTSHRVDDHRIHDKLARTLMKFGAEVTVVGLPVQEALPQNSVRSFPLRERRSRWARVLVAPFEALRAVHQVRPHVVHAHDPELLPVLLAGKALGAGYRLIYDVHEDFGHLILIREWIPARWRGWLSALLAFVEKGAARLTDAVIGVTPPLTARFPNRLRITAFNFPTQDFLRSVEEGGIRAHVDRRYDLIHVGTLNRRRAVFLAEMLQKFHELKPEARSLLLGLSPSLRDFLRPRVPKSCELLGKVPYHRVPELLLDAKVGVSIHPRLHPHLRVAFPVKVAEYLAAGCGVICSDLPVLRNLLRVYGWPEGLRLLNGSHPHEYAQEAVELVEELETAGTQLATEARSYVARHLNWETEGRKVLRLYERILGLT